ncbi:MAG: biotin synthase BioB [Synergistaceae bacterium]
MIKQIKEKIINGEEITKEEALTLLTTDLETLTQSAKEIKKHYCKDTFELCSIANAKSGLCTENCKFCAQSSYYNTKIEKYPLEETSELLEKARYNAERGISRFSLVTSGRTLTKDEITQICKIYKEINRNVKISLCASHGLLRYNDFVLLKESGVTRYHNNLETSRRYFPYICTSHTYEDKIATIKDAQKAGISVCSGGIMGLGETAEDRIDLAFELKKLKVKSTPINFLMPIEGTPLEKIKPLTQEEMIRIVAIYRFILPDNAIRLAGGRKNLTDFGKKIFETSSNATISGDMLTTCGTSIASDTAMLCELGYKLDKIK